MYICIHTCIYEWARPLGDLNFQRACYKGQNPSGNQDLNFQRAPGRS